MDNIQNPRAFPSSFDNGSEVQYNEGMTLLDYFASKAMQVLLASNLNPDYAASAGYKVARAMLIEREKHLKELLKD